MSFYDLVMCGILLIAGWKLTVALEYFMDIVWNDESAIYLQGIHILKNGIPSAEWAPFYSLWYYIISLFQPDVLKAYYLNYVIITIIFPFPIYILLRRYGLSLFESVIISVYFLLSYANLPLLPKVGHVTAIILFLTLIIATYIKEFTHTLLILAIGALLSSYIRPEFFLSFILLIVFYLCIVVIKFKQVHLRKEMMCFFSVVIISLLLITIFGQPAFNGKENRNFEAFSQHFARNWSNWTDHEMVNPWTHASEIMSNAFGNATNIREAFTNNPKLFIKHIIYNLSGFFSTFDKLLSIEHDKIFLPNNNFFHTIEKLLLLFILGWYLWYIKKVNLTAIKMNYAKHKKSLIYFGIYSVPGIISGIIISPRHHYLLVPSTLFIIIIMTLIVKDNSYKETFNLNQLLLIGIITMSVTPTPEIIYGFDYNYSPTKRANTIRFIQSLHIQKQVYILEERNDLDIFLGENFHNIPGYTKHIDFNNFVKQTNINMIIVTERLQKDPRFKYDKEWNMFLEQYSKDGYKKVGIPDVQDIQIYLHESLISSN